MQILIYVVHYLKFQPDKFIKTILNNLLLLFLYNRKTKVMATKNNIRKKISTEIKLERFFADNYFFVQLHEKNIIIFFKPLFSFLKELSISLKSKHQLTERFYNF
jgi:hypothetical protein